ncbi:nitric oxide reductase activation protein NorD [Paucibacter sp. JuS9]|uniref:nitric oxide reductase activation protein NorD n=1 Tax=Paucibacter sp. JuS9 TaxID=3228748 RepID=UPI00375672E9
MEEWIGERWHRFITRVADSSHAQAAVTLAEVERSAGLLFRAAGGPPGVRLVPAGAARSGGTRDWLQRLAGSGLRAERPQLDADTLALPPRIAVHAELQLNRDLYLWLAALAAAYQPSHGWIADNLAASARALQRCPGLRPRWERLRHAELALRPAPRSGRPLDAAEAAVHAALRDGDQAPPEAARADPVNVATVWMWLEAVNTPAAASAGKRSDSQASQRATAAANGGATRRRSRQADPDAQLRAPLLLASKLESIMTWSERASLDRGEDDEDDGNASRAADDMERLTLSRKGQTGASRIKFDLDLPSAAQDDVPLGAPLALPEWDWKRKRLLPAYCAVHTLQARPGTLFEPPPALRATARRMRRRLEVLRAAPQWQRGCTDGEALDLDAWVRHACGSQGDRRGAEPAVFARRARGERQLASLLLADLSLSTDAYCSNEQRVIDVIREALYVFGEALDGCGDAFEMLGFSSVRRSHVRLQLLKAFDERWSAAAQARVGAIKPGYYTRMGAALRAATERLAQRPERQRLLLILTDGKPNDLDVYEGRWGIEDTRHAVAQAREAGLTPFCLSIDEEAHAYLPHLFGRQGWAQVRQPTQLPQRLTALYAQLARQG